MKGSYQIVIQNRSVQYKFTLDRNITVLRGDSSTGKTTLIDMVREYAALGEQSGVNLSCKKRCVALDGAEWRERLQALHECIVFIDEGNPFVLSEEFAACIRKSDNYYVISTRERLPQLPYSVNAVYGIRKKGKYGKLKRTYNEFYLLYGENAEYSGIVEPQQVVTEDSNSGHQFFVKVCEKRGKKCFSANGNSNIYRCLRDQLKNSEKEKILVIADGAAFGAEIDRVLKMQQEYPGRLFLCLPESFEWLVLKSDILQDNEVRRILAEPSLYIACEEYFSWEQYFTALLVEKTAGTYRSYQKSVLAAYYMQPEVSDKILSVLERIRL